MAVATASSKAPAAVSGRQDDVDLLQDVLGASGVDLRAEEDASQAQEPSTVHGGGPSPAAIGPTPSMAMGHPRVPEFYLNLYPLSYRIHKIASQNGLAIDADVLMHLSLSAQTRFRNLIESMIVASRHRHWSSHLRPPPTYSVNGQPMYHEQVADDPQKLLSVLMRVEKAQEQAARQRRIQRQEEEERKALLGQVDGESGVEGTSAGGSDAIASSAKDANAVNGSGPAPVSASTQEDAKRDLKRPGPSAAARNMTEDKRLKLANKTAAQALGIASTGKSWMFGGAGGASEGINNKAGSVANPSISKLPTPKFAPKVVTEQNGNASQTGGGGGGEGSTNTANPGRWGDLAARQRHREEEERERRRRVNLEDALHALEMERKGGAGSGSGDRMLYQTRALGRPTIPAIPEAM